MTHRLSLFLGVLIALILWFAGIANAATVPVRLTTDPANQGRPSVSGNVVTWKDFRGGSWDIYMYNLTNSSESPISVHPAYQNVPESNGTVIVWQDNRNGANDIYMKDLITGITEPLVSGPGHQMVPAISGNLVAYVDNQVAANPGSDDPDNNIYVIDLNTRQISPVCEAATGQWQPRISGNKIVWQDHRNDKWDIYMKDLETGAESPVSNDAGTHDVADIDVNTVVWRDYRADPDTGVSHYDIWMKDLLSGIASPVTHDAAYQNEPRVSGDLIVWSDYRNDANTADTYYDYDIYMKDLTSGEVSGLATGNMIQYHPALDKETVVWEASSNSTTGYDIWMAKVPDTVAPVVSAETPLNAANSGCVAPLVSASYTDNRTGIDPDSISLTFDDTDVTAQAQISSLGVSYQPADALTDGTHTAVLTVADNAGNTTSTGWSFTTNSPLLSLGLVRSFWNTYDDFVAGDVSVQLRLTNSSPIVDLRNMELVDSSASAGVLMVTPLPLAVGDIQANSSADAVVKYRVPSGIANFKTKMYVAGADSCGRGYYFPGPPPGL